MAFHRRSSRRAVLVACVLAVALTMVSCASSGQGEVPAEPVDAAEQQQEPSDQEETMRSSEPEEGVADAQVRVVLDDNEAAGAFAAVMPVELDMSDLNGNEKYAYLDEPLPTSSYAPGRIEAGDVMLFGDDCLVLFYESFDTSYSYTRLGRVEDPSALAALADARTVRVSFESA